MKFVLSMFQYLRMCVLTLNIPIVKKPLRKPPFEQPSIRKAINNMLSHKFSHIIQYYKTMHELAQIFFHCLNTMDFPPPNRLKQLVCHEEALKYEREYMR